MSIHPHHIDGVPKNPELKNTRSQRPAVLNSGHFNFEFAPPGIPAYPEHFPQALPPQMNRAVSTIPTALTLMKPHPATIRSSLLILQNPYTILSCSLLGIDG